MNDDLEAIDGLCAKIIEQRDRIEALEAALREIADPLLLDVEGIGFTRSLKMISTMKNIAKAALAPEQSK
jgi:hypothetical protein